MLAMKGHKYSGEMDGEEASRRGGVENVKEK